MDWEAPVDAWYVWLAASLMAVILVGMALSVPSQPPPDANQAVNTVDRVAANSMGGTATYDHDAEMVKIGARTVSMRNDGGTQHGSVSFDRLAPVDRDDDEDLHDVLHGEYPTEVYGTSSTSERQRWQGFHNDVRDAEQDALDPEWRTANGELRVRAIEYEDPFHTGPGDPETHRAVLIEA